MTVEELAELKAHVQEAHRKLALADEVLIGRDFHPSLEDAGPTAMWFAMHLRVALHQVAGGLAECECIEPYLEPQGGYPEDEVETQPEPTFDGHWLDMYRQVVHVSAGEKNTQGIGTIRNRTLGKNLAHGDLGIQGPPRFPQDPYYFVEWATGVAAWYHHAMLVPVHPQVAG